jgi:hypothetical protein
MGGSRDLESLDIEGRIMSDDELPFYAPNRQSPPARQATPGEHVWTFIRGAVQWRAEARDFGESGVELQFHRDGEFVHGHRCETRALAVLQAQTVAEAYEMDGWTCSRCQGERWTCAAHPDQPFGHEGCDAREGEPCRDCNTSEPPRPALGFVSYLEK